MRSKWIFAAFLALVLASGGVQAMAREIPEETSLPALVEAFEKSEKQLADLKERLKTISDPAERLRLQGRIKELEEEQARLLPELEKRVGLPPPTVRTQARNNVVEHLEIQRLRDEALQDREAEKRLTGQ